MLKGFVTMKSMGEYSYETVYEFRDGYISNHGLYADYRYPKGLTPEKWQGSGSFPFYNGKKEWAISEIRFVLD